MPTPSQASSAASVRSVTFNGEQMMLDQVIPATIKKIQDMLNETEMQLILLAAAEDQSVDDETDFQMCVDLERKVAILVDGMQYHLGKLNDVTAEIRDVPPSKESRAWYVALKKEWAAQDAARNALRKDQAMAEKATRKAMVAEQKQ